MAYRGIPAAVGQAVCAAGAVLDRQLDGAIRLAAMAIVAVTLTACGGGNLGDLFSDSGPSPADQPQQQTESQVPQPPAEGAKVALLLPLSASGELGRVATALKQAGEMALLENRSSGVQLITKDTRGSPEGANAAASAALAEGAELIVGPLLANEVSAVSALAQTRGIQVIAFSSISGTARPGTYLMSFLPEEEVANLMRHAGQSGIGNIAVMLPKSAYGQTVERALVPAAQRNGVRISMIERYPETVEGIAVPARNVAGAITRSAGVVKGLMIPQGGQLLGTIGAALAQAGLPPGSIRTLGTGLWDSPDSRVAIAIGGWYAGVAPDLVANFEQRYRTTYGANPPRIASLAYDAVSLAAVLASGAAPGQRFTAQRITNPEGFQGTNGLFRFRSNGLIERGLSILEVTASGARVVAPAPGRFAAGY